MNCDLNRDEKLLFGSIARSELPRGKLELKAPRLIRIDNKSEQATGHPVACSDLKSNAQCYEMAESAVLKV